MWSFQTDPDFQAELDWIRRFVDAEVEPLDSLLGSQWNIHDIRFQKYVRPLQEQVKQRGFTKAFSTQRVWPTAAKVSSN